MKVPKWFIQITYNSFVIRTARFLRIRAFLRRFYYWLVVPKDKKIEVAFGDLRAQFDVDTPLTLRALGVICQKDKEGEHLVLANILKILEPSDVAYDIGAHIGIHTIFMAKQVKERGTIVAFEPEDKSYAVLKKNIMLNNLQNVIPLPLALGSHFAEGSLYWKNGIIGAYSLLGGDSSGVLKQKVKIAPGDDIIESYKLPLPKLVKIDVEGYEYYVIKGLEKALTGDICQMISCEVHLKMLPSEITYDKIIDLIKSYGFRRIKTSNPGETFYLFCYKL